MAKGPPSDAALATQQRLQRELADRIKQLMKDGEWTQEAIAEAAHISVAQLRLCQGGNHGPQGPTLGMLCRIADALGVELVVSLG